MRAFVLTDASLTSRAGQFVWLALDNENSKNQAALKKLPTDALPTFYVVNPESVTVVRRWVGGMTVPQLHAFLDDARVAVAAPDGPLARADRLYGTGDYAAAAEAYQAAMPALAPGDGSYARAVESLMYALSATDQSRASLALAETALPRLGRTTSGASIAGSALGAALALPDTAEGRAGWITRYEAMTRDYLADSTILMSDDDRSGTYGVLLDARSDAHDSTGAHTVAEQWAAFLEGAAARAKTPDERAVFDPHRLSAYLELGQPGKALPMLEASEKALPNDYNPPARLAIAYNALGRWDDALAATDRALAKAYGPRKLRSYLARADAFKGRGDVASARRTYEEAVSYLNALPEGQRSRSMLATLTKRRDALASPPATGH
ncbi:MAG: tetratricopeptide repeat protein [Candidatus Eisenbacteria bacterium]